MDQNREFLKIDPLEELLKALEIVRGKTIADIARRFIWHWQDMHRLDAVEWD